MEPIEELRALITVLRAAHEAATPAPWVARHSDYDDLDILAADSVRPVVMGFDWDDDDDYGAWLIDADREVGIVRAKHIAHMFTRFLFEEGAADAVAIPDMRRDAALVILLRNNADRLLSIVEAAVLWEAAWRALDAYFAGPMRERTYERQDLLAGACGAADDALKRAVRDATR